MFKLISKKKIKEDFRIGDKTLYMWIIFNITNANNNNK